MAWKLLLTRDRVGCVTPDQGLHGVVALPFKIGLRRACYVHYDGGFSLSLFASQFVLLSLFFCCCCGAPHLCWLFFIVFVWEFLFALFLCFESCFCFLPILKWVLCFEPGRRTRRRPSSLWLGPWRVCLWWGKRVRVNERREVMKAYLFAVQWASQPSRLLIGLRTKRPLCSPSSVSKEREESFGSEGLFLLAEQSRNRSAMRFRSTCEEGNSRNHAYRLRKIRVYLDSVYLTSRVHVCWLGLLSYVVISKYVLLSFGLFFLTICDVYLNPWTLVLVLIVPEYALDPMYVWIPGYMFLCWSYLPIDRILRHSDLVKSKNTPANLKCIGGHRNRTLELREAT